MTDRPSPTTGSIFGLLEWITSAVLLLVVLAVGGMVLAANRPEWLGGIALELQVVVVVVLLTVALVLVSVVALLHTRAGAE